MIQKDQSLLEQQDPSLIDQMAVGAPTAKPAVPNGELPDPTLITPPPANIDPSVEMQGIGDAPIATETILPQMQEVTPADVSSPFSVGKAQGGEGEVPTTITDGIQPFINQEITPEVKPAGIGDPMDMAIPVIDPPGIGDPTDPGITPTTSDVPPPTAITEPVDAVLPPPPDVRDNPIVNAVNDQVAVETNQQGHQEPTSPPAPQIDIAALMAALDAQFGATGSAPVVGAIDPENDLRSTVITGAPSDRTNDARSGVDAATKAMTTDTTGLAAQQTKAAQTALGVDPTKVAGANDAVSSAFAKLSGTDRQGLVDQLISQYMQQVGPDARLQKLQSQVDASADSLAGVDRYKLARDQFDTFAQDTDPVFQKTLRDIMERETAAGGFTGRINTSLGDAGYQREQALRSERSRLLQQALSDSVQDALSKTNTLSGLEGQLSSQNLSRYKTAADLGITNADSDIASLTNTLSGARGIAGDLTAAENAAMGHGTSRASQQLDAERARLAAEQDREGRSFGEDQTEANALRGERNYQVGQEDEAYQRALAQYREEQMAQESAFEREMAILGAGEAGNPSSQIGALATMINPALDMATLAQLANSAGYSAGSKTASPGGFDWGALIDSLMKGNTPIPKPTSTNVPSTLPG